MSDKSELRAEQADFGRYIQIFHFGHRDGKRFVGEKIEIRDVDEGELVEPMLRIGRDKAQALMDDLWRCGLRPTEGSGSAGSLAATEKHLKDMRKIAGKFLEVEL